MKWTPFLIFLAVIMLVSSSSLGDFISVGDYNIRPSLMLIVMIFFAINCEIYEAMICSFVIGLAADISSSAMVIGPHTVSFVFVGTAISFLQGPVVMQRLVYQGICILLSGFVAATMTEAMIYKKLSGMTLYSFEVIAMTVLYSALIGPFIWLVLKPVLHIILIEPPSYTRKGER